MLEKIVKTANKSEKELVFEIGSNSDLVLENVITDNLAWTIENFVNKSEKGMITFPTKFDMVDPILNLDHKGRVIIRMSVNPQEIIRQIEIGTSPLKNRVEAINKLKKAGYKIGILIAPVILVENWKEKYEELVKYLYENLSNEVKKDVFFEIIFMTYSYIHKVINQDAFPDKESLYNKDLMTVRGRGRYTYKKEVKEDGSAFFEELLGKYFENCEIKYIT